MLVDIIGRSVTVLEVAGSSDSSCPHLGDAKPGVLQSGLQVLSGEALQWGTHVTLHTSPHLFDGIELWVGGWQTDNSWPHSRMMVSTLCWGFGRFCLHSSSNSGHVMPGGMGILRFFNQLSWSQLWDIDSPQSAGYGKVHCPPPEPTARSETV